MPMTWIDSIVPMIHKATEAKKCMFLWWPRGTFQYRMRVPDSALRKSSADPRFPNSTLCKSSVDPGFLDSTNLVRTPDTWICTPRSENQVGIPGSRTSYSANRVRTPEPLSGSGFGLPDLGVWNLKVRCPKYTIQQSTRKEAPVP